MNLEKILDLPEEEFNQLSGEVYLADKLVHDSYLAIMLKLGSDEFKLPGGRVHEIDSKWYDNRDGNQVNGGILSLCVHQGTLYDCGFYGIYDTLANKKIDFYVILAGTDIKARDSSCCLCMESKDDGLYCETLSVVGQRYAEDEERNEYLEPVYKQKTYQINPKSGEAKLVEEHDEIHSEKINEQRKVPVQGELLRAVLEKILVKKGRGQK